MTVATFLGCMRDLDGEDFSENESLDLANSFDRMLCLEIFDM